MRCAVTAGHKLALRFWLTNSYSANKRVTCVVCSVWQNKLLHVQAHKLCRVSNPLGTLQGLLLSPIHLLILVLLFRLTRPLLENPGAQAQTIRGGIRLLAKPDIANVLIPALQKNDGHPRPKGKPAASRFDN